MKKIHHFLHEQAVGTAETDRIDSRTLVCLLPGNGEVCQLSVDERDQRSLVVFDGELLYGGLPKSATVVQSVSLGAISCPSDSVRKNITYPCEARPKYQENAGKTEVEIFRYFLLLPSCAAIVRKYRNRSLSPIYVVIRVFSNEQGTKVVEWETTSY